MEEGSEPCFHVSPNSCCPVPFLSASPSPSRTPALDRVLNYNDRLLTNSDAILDIHWSPYYTDGIDKLETLNGLQEGRGEKLPSWYYPGRRLQWCSGKTTCRFCCGTICNPILTSRLALTGILAVLITCMTVLAWVFAFTNVEHTVRSVAATLRQEILLHAEDITDIVLQGNNAATLSLAKLLSSSIIQGSLTSFSTLEEQVRPILFLIFSIFSGRTQVSYFGKNGMFMSYWADSHGMAMLYANTSYLHPGAKNNTVKSIENPWLARENLTVSRPWYHWYRQSADASTGLPIGEAIPFAPIPYWGLDVFNDTWNSELGAFRWDFILGESSKLLYFSSTPVKQDPLGEAVGAVAMGIPVGNLQGIFEKFDTQEGHIYLATKEGHLVAQTGSPFKSSGRYLDIVHPPLAIYSNNEIVAEAASFLKRQLSDVSELSRKSYEANNVNIQGAHYMIKSVPVQLAGTTMVCVVIIPRRSIWGPTEKRSHITLTVLVALAVCMGVVGCFLILLMIKGVRNEMQLRAALIQQLEARKQAEMKSSHKSLVFANMSHDLRTPLAAILGLIDLCLCDSSECSELEANLLQMKSCATNLLGILNSVLDMSKIEAGKLQLQETDFDLVNVLEEVVEIFSVIGLKKGVEVVLDLSDGTVEKASHVRGDAGRVKQIMANLLSNGVKFTTEGHVVLRAWIKSNGLITAETGLYCKRGLFNWPWFQHLRRQIFSHKSTMEYIEHDNHVEVEFEVDDTGRGIPKERWKAVFENFVQVEASIPRSYDGTGLGLGIVRSLVRLMGGNICIIDKDEPGEPGTRFRFNLIFKSSKNLSNNNQKQGCSPVVVKHRESLQDSFCVNTSSVIQHLNSNANKTSATFPCLEVHACNSPLPENVHVLLAMQGMAGRKVVKKWMEMRGLQVWEIDHPEEFVPTFEKIKQEIFSQSFSTSERFDLISPESQVCDTWFENLDLRRTGRNMNNYDSCVQKFSASDCPSTANYVQRINVIGARSCLILLIDIAMFSQSLNALLFELENNLLDDDHGTIIKVVWLVTPNTPSSDLQELRKGNVPSDLILHKPLHLSRLQCIWGLLEDLVGSEEQKVGNANSEFVSSKHYGNAKGATDTLYKSLSCISTFQVEPNVKNIKGSTKNLSSLANRSGYLSSINADGGSRIQREGDSNHSRKYEYLETNNVNKWLPTQTPEKSPLYKNPEKVPFLRGKGREDAIVVHEKSLSGMSILVAEDNPVLQRLTKTLLARLGATVVCVDNGAEAAHILLQNLYRSRIASYPEEHATHLGDVYQDTTALREMRPFDIVLMDCEMPVLDGYEATQRIREGESRYGVHTPVIALTAHAMAQDEEKCIQAGMDFYLTKPLATKALLSVIGKVNPGKHLDSE